MFGVVSQFWGELNGALFNTIIEVDTRLRESPAFGQPITLYAPKTRAAQQYRQLAEELKQFTAERTGSEKPASDFDINFRGPNAEGKPRRRRRSTSASTLPRRRRRRTCWRRSAATRRTSR